MNSYEERNDTRKSLLFLICVVASSLFVYVILPTKSSSPKQQSLSLEEKTEQKHVAPNFVYILADDLAWNSMGYQNFDLDVTPHLTAFAKDGIILDNFYAQEVFSWVYIFYIPPNSNIYLWLLCFI